MKIKAVAMASIIVIVLGYFVVLPGIFPHSILQGYKLPTISDPGYPINFMGTATQPPPCATTTGLGVETCTSYSVSGPVATYTGTLFYGDASPVCPSGNTCPRRQMLVFYLVADNGTYYRLLFQSGNPRLANGTRVIATGVLIEPTSWHRDEWMPPYAFQGDLYVQTIKES